MSINLTPIEILALSKRDGYGQVTYIYDDGIIVDGEFREGTKQVCPINKQMFYGERGTSISLTEVLNVFRDTVRDRGAKRFILTI